MATLTLVGLPIGNPADITRRACDFLSVQRSFLAEDTRRFKRLLQFLDISLDGKRISSFHDAAQDKLATALKRLARGEDLALVSDAGSPIVSDPAFPLVEQALRAGHQVATLPGVSAVLAALELSGLPPHPFSFHGFWPRGQRELARFFAAHLAGTHIAFESPRRIKASLELLGRLFPSARICVARELTKTFEQVVRFRGDDSEALQALPELGEFTVVYHLAKGAMHDSRAVELAREVLGNPGQKRLAKLLAHLLEREVGEVYTALGAMSRKK